MLSQGVGLLSLTLLAKLAGFCRDVVLSYFYGASSIVDAYIVATTIPMVVFSFVGTGIETSLIPMLNKVENEGADKDKFISNIVNVFIIACIIAIVVIICFPEPVVKLFASGFDDETLKIAVSFTIFSTLTYICTSVLHYRHKFVAAAFSTILMDGIVLLFVTLSNFLGVFLLPIGNVIAFAVQALFLCLFVKYHYYFSIDLSDKYLLEMVKIIIPVVIGTSVNQINLLIDQTLASKIMVGGISYLNYSNKVLGVVQGVFILSFVSLLFPRMTEMVRLQKIDDLIDHMKQWSIILQFVLVPCTILFCLYSNDIICLLFQRGEFNANDTYYTALVLFCYAIELPFYGQREIISRVYYTYRNTRIPMSNSILGLIVNVIVSILLALTFGLVGLPIGTTVSCIITAFFIAIHFRHDFCPQSGIEILKRIINWDILFLVSVLIISFLIKDSIRLNSNWGFVIEIIIILMLYSCFNGFFLIKKNILALKKV